MHSTGLSPGATRVAFDGIFVAWIGAELWIRQSRPPLTAAHQDGDTRSWIGLAYLLGVLGGIVLADRGVGPVIAHHNVPLFAVGVTMAFLGVALRLWAVHTLGRIFQLVPPPLAAPFAGRQPVRSR